MADKAKNDVRFRRAHQGDFDEIARIWYDSASLPGVGPPEMPTISDLRLRIDNEIADGWSITVAVNAIGILGFVATKPAAGILDQLFIAPDAIGTGIGKLLFSLAQEEMNDGFRLHTAESNARARSFYEGTGMVLTHHADHPRTGHPIVWYEWRPTQ